MGSLDQLAGMIPGVNAKQLKDAKIDEKMISHQEAIIRSMTPRERAKPDILTSSRKKRIAAGSGTTVEEINRLLQQYNQIVKMMKQFSNPAKMQKMLAKGKLKMPF
jgi:signal recognition particle subunit SRP54